MHKCQSMKSDRVINTDWSKWRACRCKECERLKDVEDKWTLRLGSLHGPVGLNSRDEIQAESSKHRNIAMKCVLKEIT